MAEYKAIMTLALAGHSYSEIVAAVGCSRREIAAVKKTITAYGITAAKRHPLRGGNRPPRQAFGP
ncbi:hypothetical protein [Dietzia sp. E1]|uniref:hypothetical protein n=1 Tax=Dietzia sp. E1 TaxID=328361 RepID=UPI0019D555D1|nr:hypothetical protein [Dietzia sp. E1]